jgi:1,2-diacylglycerol 3-alpha-glucosyltransferase
MRVLHCCLAAFYIDDFGYQENIFPREHLRQGHDVEVLASTETYGKGLKLAYTAPSRYLASDGYWVTRVPYVRWLPSALARKLRIYTGVRDVLEEFRPDVVFLHDLQFLSIFTIVSYCRARRSVRLFVDTHTDGVNSGRGFLSRWVLHGLIYRLCAMAIEPYARRFWATLPLRAEFLVGVYGVPRSKISLLPFGADDGRQISTDRNAVRERIRKGWGVNEDDFVFVFGGKIDARKNTLQLLTAFAELTRRNPELRVWLVVFGEPVAELESEFRRLSAQRRVITLGWLPAERSHEVFWSSDFAVFPGTHSVLWEEAAGLGLPLAVKRWSGIEHIDVGGNCMFLETSDVPDIYRVMHQIVTDPLLYSAMKAVASSVAVAEFSYSRIAARALE